MVGDDMAILSGGMYGNPESQYTYAMPNEVPGFWGNLWGGTKKTLGITANLASAGFDLYASHTKLKGNIEQAEANLTALREEKEYNVKNYEQFIADQLASNKISFYSSGLDYKTGTAKSVIESNRAASTEDMNMMIKNYDTRIESLKKQRNAAEKAYSSGMASAVLGVF